MYRASVYLSCFIAATFFIDVCSASYVDAEWTSTSINYEHEADWTRNHKLWDIMVLSYSLGLEDDEDAYIFIEFQSFDVGNNKDCSKNFVSIAHGTSSYGENVTYCGSDLPPSFTGEGDGSVRMTCTTSGSVPTSFKATYRAITAFDDDFHGPTEIESEDHYSYVGGGDMDWTGLIIGLTCTVVFFLFCAVFMLIRRRKRTVNSDRVAIVAAVAVVSLEDRPGEPESPPGYTESSPPPAYTPC